MDSWVGGFAQGEVTATKRKESFSASFQRGLVRGWGARGTTCALEVLIVVLATSSAFVADGSAGSASGARGAEGPVASSPQHNGAAPRGTWHLVPAGGQKGVPGARAGL